MLVDEGGEHRQPCLRETVLEWTRPATTFTSWSALQTAGTARSQTRPSLAFTLTMPHELASVVLLSVATGPQITAVPLPPWPAAGREDLKANAPRHCLWGLSDDDLGVASLGAPGLDRGGVGSLVAPTALPEPSFRYGSTLLVVGALLAMGTAARGRGVDGLLAVLCVLGAFGVLAD